MIPLLQTPIHRNVWADPAYGSSSFGIVVVQFVDGQLQILHAEEYKRPDFNGNARFQILISCFIVITLISVPLITTITSDNSGLSFDNGFTISRNFTPKRPSNCSNINTD